MNNILKMISNDITNLSHDLFKEDKVIDELKKDEKVLKYIKHLENKKELESKIQFLRDRKINLIYGDCNHEFLICNNQIPVKDEIIFDCFCPSCNAHIKKFSNDEFFHERKNVNTTLSDEEVSNIYNSMILNYNNETDFIRSYLKFIEHIRDKEASEKQKKLIRIK